MPAQAPSGASSVAHGLAGLWGLIAVGLFTGDASLPIQFVGASAIMVRAFSTSFAVFKRIDKIMGIRVTAVGKLIGLDYSEHGGSAYPEFIFQEQVANATEH